mmetsp:Transcript_60252/g.123776  ORF Transcript_60252/g.123776 Transcript_60252/m.123776 type:complete len:349 (-) Transcript_60252:190-1236(-)
MFRQQVALRGMLGDPWPTMVLDAGANGSQVDDRVQLVASLQEMGRLGASSLTRGNEAHREIAEQHLISAATSAEALSSILRDSVDSQQGSTPHGGPSQQQPAAGPPPRTPPSPAQESRIRKMRKVAPAEGNDGEQDSPSDSSSSSVPLTAMERKLMEAYQFPFPDPVNLQQGLQHGPAPSDCADPLGQDPLGASISASLQSHCAPQPRDKLPTVNEGDSADAKFEEAERTAAALGQALRQSVLEQSKGPNPTGCSVVLDGGSSIEPFTPSSSRVLPTSPSGGGGPKGAWGQTKILTKMVREADQNLTDGTPIPRATTQMPHASIFGAFRHLQHPEDNIEETMRESINH